MYRMADYSQSKIYKLYIPGIDDICYVGSTVNSLEWRLNHHKHQASNEKQNKTGASCLFEDDNEVVIELLEKYPCSIKEELQERERYWIEKFPDCVNKNIPTRGWRERWFNKHQHNLQKHREWLRANKEEEAEKQRQRRLADLEAARAKDKESNKKRDKDKRKEWKNKKVICDKCKLVLSRNNFPTHKKNLHPNEEVAYTLLEQL